MIRSGIVLLLSLATFAQPGVATICSNYLLPSSTEIRKFNVGSEKLIPRACLKQPDRYDVLKDEDVDGTADLFQAEDYVTRKGNMLFDASVKFQRKLCGKNPKSSYCCANGIESIDIIKIRPCWLKLGLTTRVNGKAITATRDLTNGTATGVFKVSDVWAYRCNGEEDRKTVSITYDSAYEDGCFTPEQVWKM